MKKEGPQVSQTFPSEAEEKRTDEWDGAKLTGELRKIFVLNYRTC